MTKKEKELVEKLKAEMPEFSGNKVDIEKKIAMYLYLYIGKSKVFDEKYFLGNEETRKRIVRNNTRDLLIVKKNELSTGDEDPIIEKRTGVCETIANLYERLLNDFNINAKAVKTGDDDVCVNEGEREEHVSVVITLSDGEQILANPQEDLSNIQTRSKTVNFGRKYENGIETGESLNDNEMFELHKVCGYVEKKEDYMDTKIENLAKRVEKMTASQILPQIVNDSEIGNYQGDIGYIELYKFYSGIIKSVAKKYAQNGINYFNCYREVENDSDNSKCEREYYMCMYSTFNSKVSDVYLYSNKAKKFGKIELEKLKELQDDGLHLGRNNSEPGKKILERALRNLGKKTDKQSYKS